MCLTDIVTPALVVFERVVSSTLKNGVINEEEFNMLQTLHLETLNELTVLITGWKRSTDP